MIYSKSFRYLFILAIAGMQCTRDGSRQTAIAYPTPLHLRAGVPDE